MNQRRWSSSPELIGAYRDQGAGFRYDPANGGGVYSTTAPRTVHGKCAQSRGLAVRDGNAPSPFLVDATALFLEQCSASMRVYFSTVVRGAPLENAGELVALDWDRRQVLGKVPVFPTDPAMTDPNTRGGGRGGRGIVLRPGEVWVASYHRLLGFTPDLQPVRTITNNNFAGLHELKLVDDSVWTSSTPLGCVQQVGFDGAVRAQWWAHDDPLVQREFPAAPLTVDKTQDNRLRYLADFSKYHLNNVEVFDGRVYVCFNNHGAVLRLFPTEIISRDPALKGCHNGLVTEDGEILLNDSHQHTVVVLDRESGRLKKRINLIEFPEVARLARLAGVKNVSPWVRFRNLLIRKRMTRPLFTRGMCRLDDARLLVGVSPATVLEIDYKKSRLLGMFQYSTSANECIHGLEAAPSVDFPFEHG